MHLFSVYFCNSFVTYFILTRTYVCYQNPSNKNIDNVELRFYSVVTCLTLPILHNVFQSVRRSDIGTILGVLFHYSTNFKFLCVVKNEQETDSQGLSGQNQDDKLHR